MPVSQLIDIALYNNPSTRASWYTARAAAFGYYVSLSEYYPTVVVTGDIDFEHITGGTSISSTFVGNQVGTGTTTQGTALGTALRGHTEPGIESETPLSYRCYYIRHDCFSPCENQQYNPV